jgi:hypothetical protein
MRRIPSRPPVVQISFRLVPIAAIAAAYGSRGPAFAESIIATEKAVVIAVAAPRKNIRKSNALEYRIVKSSDENNRHSKKRRLKK